MNTNETERDGAYDRACRDPRDNCPTEGAVLKREWRQKTATIAMLTKMVNQQTTANTEMKDALLALYVALRDSAPKLSPAAGKPSARRARFWRVTGLTFEVSGRRTMQKPEDTTTAAVGSPLESLVRHQPTLEGETTMGTFTTKLKLGGEAFGVNGGLDPTIQRLTVGQIRVIETLPSSRFFADDVCYKEEYMCVETGVGGGTVWTYGKNIFATEAEAQTGVIAHQQAAYKQRAERDAYRAQEAERQRQNDLLTLERLKQRYEAAGGVVDA